MMMNKKGVVGWEGEENSFIYDSCNGLTADELAACQNLLPPACLFP